MAISCHLLQITLRWVRDCDLSDGLRRLEASGETLHPRSGWRDRTTYTRAEMLDYLDLVDRGVDGWVDAIDYASSESGFSWYSIPKLDHQILNIRHLGVHTGQLQELLFARGIDLDWMSRRP